MAKFDVFAGRRNELDQIRELVKGEGTTRLILIEGEGGAGKTFLLRKFETELREQSHYLVDYYDLAELPPGNLREAMHIVDSLGRDNFPQFMEHLRQLSRRSEEAVADLTPEPELLEIGFKELYELNKSKRFIRITDTLESAVPTREGEQEFFAYARGLPNALFISAGRDLEPFLPGFIAGFGEENITRIHLEPFDQIESEEFFAQVDSADLISADLRTKLHFLTSGRPVLLSLAVEWLRKEVPLPEIADRPIDELQALSGEDLEDLRQLFEFQLVGQVRSLKSPQDKALLYMAAVNRRTNLRILEVLLGISRDDAAILLRNLAELPFVKYNPATMNCVLHDEMHRLIHRHVWSHFDFTGEIRKKLLRDIIDRYYEPMIAQLAKQVQILTSDPSTEAIQEIERLEWEQWYLEAESLYYHLQLGETIGRQYYEARHQEARRNRQFMRIIFLLGELERAGISDSTSALSLRRAEAKRYLGQYHEASEICLAIVNNPQTAVRNCFEAYVLLAQMTNNPEKAEAFYLEALNQAKKVGDNRLQGIVYNNLGQLSRRRNQLRVAIDYYEQAIDFGKQAGNLALVASAMNNAAYIYQIMGDLSKAESYGSLALSLRKREGVDRELAYSYITLGDIDRNKGDMASANHHLKQGLTLFRILGDVRGQALSCQALANVHRHMGEYKLSEAYLKQALDLVTSGEQSDIRTKLYNNFARLHRSQALEYLEQPDKLNEMRQLLQSAEQYAQLSLDGALKNHDDWLIARNELELALIYILTGDRLDAQIHELLERAWERAAALNNQTLMGYAHEQWGQLALRQKDYAKAAEHFGRSAVLTAEWPGRDQGRFFDRLRDIILDVRLPQDASRILATGILKIIEAAPSSPPLKSLRELCSSTLDVLG